MTGFQLAQTPLITLTLNNFRCYFPDQPFSPIPWIKQTLMEKRLFPLSAITKRINELLEPAISKQFWVKAEVSSGRERGGAFYCDLIETDAGGKIVAKIGCNIWQRELTSIRELFKSRSMDLQLDNGTVVGFLCSLQFSPQYGLSLRVLEADPAYAMGEMELKKREIIERLQKEGLFRSNKECFLPMLPLRIGLITSNGSAAYNDFVQTLIASGFGFKIIVADAMMQGDQVEKSVLLALERLCKVNVELIVVARGGGSKTDLYHLDNETIARRIAGCSIPVWTGIGHEIDTSVLDYVANKSFKTPTAIAEELVARFVQMRRQLAEAANALKTVWAHRLKMDQDYLERSRIGLRQGTRKLLDVTVSGLREQAQALRLCVKSRITKELISTGGRKERLHARSTALLQKNRERLQVKQDNLKSRTRFTLTVATNTLGVIRQRFDRNRFYQRLQSEQRSLNDKLATLKASDPQNVLLRGFSLVYHQDGNHVKSVHDINEKDNIRIRLADGNIVSQVTAKEAKP